MKTKPDYELLERYIRKILAEKERTAVERLLRTDRTWFEAHLELKEALVLSETGVSASPSLREQVQGMVRRERTGFVSILITIVKEKITISSADQSGQDFQGVSAEFALRGTSEAGPVTITRKIEGRNVTILLTPLERKGAFAFAVTLDKKETLSARLIVDEIELEKIDNVGRAAAFESRLQAPCNIDVVFSKKGKEVFTVNLKLRSETRER
ncbi:MAG: hypothetical protein J0L53_06480 [Spirochaetes bacterium]|nr:hypothetical protein [Spirochaetota bacterium]